MLLEEPSPNLTVSITQKDVSKTVKWVSGKKPKRKKKKGF